MMKPPPEHPADIVWPDERGKWWIRVEGRDYGPFDLRGLAISRGRVKLDANIRGREARRAMFRQKGRSDAKL